MADLNPARNTVGMGPLLTLRNVSKEYAPASPMRARRLFARLRGIEVGESFPELLEDDEWEELDPDDADHSPQTESSRRVVDRVSLEAYGGSVLALLGPPGAGKTSLLRLIAGIVPPTEGRIVVRGRVAPALGLLAGSLPKGHNMQSALLHLAAITGLPRDLVRSRLDVIAAILDLPQLAKTPTSALESRKKREAILATMLSVDPDVVVTDIQLPRDPLGERFVERIEDLRRRGSLVIIEAKNARKLRPAPDRVVQFARGRVVADDTDYGAIVRRASGETL